MYAGVPRMAPLCVWQPAVIPAAPPTSLARPKSVNRGPRHLQGYLAAQPRVEGQEDDAEGASPQLAADDEAAEPRRGGLLFRRPACVPDPFGRPKLAHQPAPIRLALQPRSQFWRSS